MGDRGEGFGCAGGLDSLGKLRRRELRGVAFHANFIGVKNATLIYN